MPNIVKARLIQEVEPEVELKSFSTEDTSTENIVESKEKIYIQQKSSIPESEESSEESDNLIRFGMKKAQDIIKNAEDMAEQIMVNARRQSRLLQEKSEEQGYKEGFDKGYAESIQNEEAKLKVALDEISKITEAIIEMKISMLKSQEQEILKISLEIAKKIMRQHVESNKDSIPKMIEEIIKENEKAVKVYISEYNKTLQFVVDKEMYDKIKSLAENLRVIVIKDDEQDERSQDTLEVETEYGMVEANVGRQLESLKSTLGI